jgi:hypothetical protein
MSEHEHDEETATGVVDELDGQLAKIIIGSDASEWYFPLELLPARVEVGTCLWFAQRDGRWVPLGIAQERPTPTTRSIEDRLGRHITDRRFGGT